jgi:hypothetical protein
MRHLIENSSNNVNEELFTVLSEALNNKDRLKQMGEKGFEMAERLYQRKGH